MDEYPATLSARLRLPTGDQLPVTAFRVGFDREEGMMHYELKAEDGTPLNISPDGVVAIGIDIDVLPACSMIVWPQPS